MSGDQQPDERDRYYHAAECLDAASRELSAAADDLRGIASIRLLAEIVRAKDAIDRARGEIGAQPEPVL
jgi:hypothetical protein